MAAVIIVKQRHEKKSCLNDKTSLLHKLQVLIYLYLPAYNVGIQVITGPAGNKITTISSQIA